MSADRLTLLRRLQQTPGVVVGIISGRTLGDLRWRVPLDEAFFIGLHGLEIAGPQFKRTQAEGMDPYYTRMLDVAARLHRLVARTPGVRVECKGPVVALHTREASSEHVVWSRFQLLGAASDLVNSESVRVLRGHDVLELCPNVGFSRADALATVRRCIEGRHGRRVFTVYIGEDAVDDDAGTAVGVDGITAVVGRRARAEYRLSSPEDVDAVIAGVIRSRQDGSDACAQS